MVLVYEASNSIEAHMILNLLKQADLSGRIDGEYLQGGVGEIQPMGIVRVLTEKSDHAKAKVIIDEWEVKQPKEEPQTKVKNNSSLGANIISFIAGILLMIFYYNTPVERDGVDYNGDGTLDETWTYVNYLMSEAEIDRNLDGKVDSIFDYDRKGVILTSKEDNNFDGIFETEIFYRNGNVIWTKSDTTGDDFKDYKVEYKFGIIEKVHFINAKTEKIVKIQHYNMSRLISANIDTNNDGIFDMKVEYDSIEEKIK
jgi:hypothetical protein